TVNNAPGALWIAQDVQYSVDMCLQEFVHQIWMCIKERFVHNHIGGDKLAIRPQSALIDKDFTVPLNDQASCPWFRYQRTIDLSCFEQCQNVRIIGRDHLYISTFLGVLKAILLDEVGQ